MTSKVTNTPPIFLIPELFIPIVRNLDSSDQGRFFQTTKEFYPLITDAISQLPKEQQCAFFSNRTDTRFFALQIEKAETNEQIPVVKRVDNIAWLASCATPKERRRLMEGAFSLLQNASHSEVRDMLHHLTSHLIPKDKGSYITANTVDEAVLFDYLRYYLEHSEKVDSIPMLIYWMCFTATLDEAQKTKNNQDLINFLSSKKISSQVEEQLVTLYSYALSLFKKNDDAKYDHLKEIMLDHIRFTLEKEVVPYKIKIQTLCNLTSALCSINTNTIDSKLYKKFQSLIEKLTFQVEENLSSYKKQEIVNNLLSALHYETIYADWMLVKINYFFQKAVDAENIGLTMQRLIISLYCSAAIRSEYTNNFTLFLLEEYATKPISEKYKEEISDNLKSLNNDRNFVYLHERLKIILKKIRNYPTLIKNNNSSTAALA